MLTAPQRAALRAALRRRPPDGGLWSGPKAARYARDRRRSADWRRASCRSD